MTFLQRIQNAYGTEGLAADRGASAVETILITLAVAAATVFVIGIITVALSNRAVDTSNCIEGSNSYTNAQAGDDACSGKVTDREPDKSFKAGEGYQKRGYGS